MTDNQNQTAAITPVDLEYKGPTLKGNAIPNEPMLVGIRTALKIIFPDPATRPGLRTMNSWKQKGYFPFVKIGKRVFLDPATVRKALDRRFTIEASN